MTMLAERHTGIEDDVRRGMRRSVVTPTGTHHLVYCPLGAMIAMIRIDNDAVGYAKALGWIAEHAPGPRVLIRVGRQYEDAGDEHQESGAPMIDVRILGPVEVR